MRGAIDRLVTLKSLSFVSTVRNEELFDFLGRHSDESLQGAEIRNVCAKLSQQLSEEIDEVCQLLGMSKRRFIEAALVDALRQAHVIMEEEGVSASLVDFDPKLTEVEL